MRQYIGARYVPKFEGDWVNNKTYEALTVVSYMGDSYTSKKPVPVGVVPTDSNYWALTGAYNSQVALLAATVGDSSTGLVHDVDILKQSNGLWSLEEMADKTVILIGDSWGNTGLQRTNNWIDLITPYFKKVYRTAADGYSFATTGASFIDLLNGVTLDPGDVVDAIIAIGGANGITDGDVVAFINAARTAYPDSQIIVGANGPCVPASIAWRTEREIEVEASKMGCFSFHELWLTIAKTPITNWTTDVFHLRDSSAFADNIIAYLTTGKYCHTFNKRGSFGMDYTGADTMCEYFKDVSYSAYTTVDNEFMIQLYNSKGANYTAASDSISVTNGTYYKLGKIDVPFAVPFYNNSRMDNNPSYFAYQIYETTNYIIYLHGIKDTPYCDLVMLAKVTGTFTKAQFFTETYTSVLSAKGKFFDFAGLSEIGSSTMLVYTYNQILGM